MPPAKKRIDTSEGFYEILASKITKYKIQAALLNSDIQVSDSTRMEFFLFFLAFLQLEDK
jgi:hypothetical protein